MTETQKKAIIEKILVEQLIAKEEINYLITGIIN